jgi:hypothetical protein
MLSMACAGASWSELGSRLWEAMNARWSENTSLETVAESLVNIARHCVARRPESLEHAEAVEMALGALRQTEAFRIARTVSADGADAAAALLLLIARLRSTDAGPLSVRLASLSAEAARLPPLVAELDRLEEQWKAIRRTWPGNQVEADL